MEKFYYASPIGELTIVSKDQMLIGLWLEKQKYYGGGLAVEDMKKATNPSVKLEIIDWLDRYFNGKKPKAEELILAPQGSDFRQEVWHILCSLPYGETVTYGQIAQKIAKKRGLSRMSAQAVGGAVGHNPISIIIPCHRVMGSKGNLTGYAGGIENKQYLLSFEKTGHTNWQE